MYVFVKFLLSISKQFINRGRYCYDWIAGVASHVQCPTAGGNMNCEVSFNIVQARKMVLYD
jgi:hypothetical protein